MLSMSGLLLILALALAADAFAVSLCQGAAARPGFGSAVRVGAAFGLAQAVMPLFGWSAGVAFAELIRQIDHWVAFLLLGALGLRTLKEGLSAAEAGGSAPRLSGWALFSAAFATSIDAAAAGVTLPAIGAPVAIACAVIGVVTLVLCIAGVLMGRAGGARLGKKAEIAGGIALLAIGTKILIEHVFLGG